MPSFGIPSLRGNPPGREPWAPSPAIEGPSAAAAIDVWSIAEARAKNSSFRPDETRLRVECEDGSAPAVAHKQAGNRDEARRPPGAPGPSATRLEDEFSKGGKSQCSRSLRLANERRMARLARPVGRRVTRVFLVCFFYSKLREAVGPPGGCSWAWDRKSSSEGEWTVPLVPARARRIWAQPAGAASS